MFPLANMDGEMGYVRDGGVSWERRESEWDRTLVMIYGV